MQKNYDCFGAEQFLDDAFFIAWIKHKAPEAEAFWEAWIKTAPPNLADMREAETQLRAFLSARRIEVENEEAERVWQRVQDSLSSLPVPFHQIEKEENVASKAEPLYKIGWAAVFLVLATAGFMLLRNTAKKETVAVNNPKPVLQADVAPGGDKAILTLADGRKVVLDSGGNGDVAEEGGTKISKSGGQVLYATYNKTFEVLYNTVSTPKGGQYRLLLSDGTKVWLNAASSLRFPTAFTGKERSVELTGEGYFEVALNEAVPFGVKVAGMEVQVLGTHFNINSYADEPASKTTLLEGKVLVKKGDKALYLQPGQQAITNNEGAQNSITVNQQADVEAVMAWKNGLFVFDNSDLPKILRDLSRWYDMDVQIEGSLSGKELFGIVNRNSPLSSVMKALKSGSPVPFTYRMEGKKLTVQAAKK